MKVSVIQMNMRSLESKANFDRAEALVRRAVGGKTAPTLSSCPRRGTRASCPRATCRGVR